MPQDFVYSWPGSALDGAAGWHDEADGTFRRRDLPETDTQLAADSRWPAFFPSPICLVTTTDGTETGFEKVVGPSIVNRFPYIAALGFCRRPLSDRHHVRSRFCELLEAGGSVAIQFLPQGQKLAAALKAVADAPDQETSRRLGLAKLDTRPGRTVEAPVLTDAYLVYEGRLVEPGRDFSGQPIFQQAWSDVGSHRIYFIEITAIQLRADIARGDSRIYWQGLPEWSPDPSLPAAAGITPRDGLTERYQKGYTPRYMFPSADTVAFEPDATADGMTVKHLSPLPGGQVEIDNDRARWPCFFPSPTGMITSRAGDGQPNMMPCGSTTVVSRHPMIIAACVSYSAINERYAPRASLNIIREAGAFGCGVAYIDDPVIEAIRYSGTTSLADDPDKIVNSGLHIADRKLAPQITDFPIHFECRLVGETRLGTHIMFLGEVESILVRRDLSAENPMTWNPWADVRQEGSGR